jgi:hypothetical protein
MKECDDRIAGEWNFFWLSDFLMDIVILFCSACNHDNTCSL